MGLPAKLLSEDERVVMHLRTHPKKLVGPVAWFIVLAALLGSGLAVIPRWVPAVAAGWVQLAWGVLLAVGLVVWVLVPVLRWATTTYTFTDRRIISRAGLLTKTGHDLPLRRVSAVSYQRSLSDRVLGCGTLVLTTAAEQPVVLRDIPEIERVHVAMNDLLFATEPELEDPYQTW